MDLTFLKYYLLANNLLKDLISFPSNGILLVSSAIVFFLIRSFMNLNFSNSPEIGETR